MVAAEADPIGAYSFKKVKVSVATLNAKSRSIRGFNDKNSIDANRVIISLSSTHHSNSLKNPPPPSLVIGKIGQYRTPPPLV